MGMLQHISKYSHSATNKLCLVDKLPVSFDSTGNPISFLDNDTWVFDVFELGYLAKKKIGISSIPMFIREAFYTTYLSPDAPSRVSKVSTLLSNLRTLLMIANNHPVKDCSLWFCKKGLTSFLSAIKGKYAFGTVESLLHVYLQLSNSDNSAGTDQFIKINVFKTAKKHCNAEHSEKKQTLSMPLGVASKIMSNALSLFNDAVASQQSILNMVKEIRLNRKHHGSSNYEAPINIIKSNIEGTQWASCLEGNFRSQYVGFWLNRTIYACHHLIMAFSGVRIHELKRLHNHSFKSYHEDGFTYYTITAETSKMEKGEDVVDTWVCAKMCETILTFISELKLSADIESPSIMLTFPHLFAPQIKTHNTYDQRFTRNLVLGTELSDADYKEYCQLNRERVHDLSVGDLWPLANHQWRRTFATMALRFDLATLPAIKRQFKHVSLQMTEWYTNYARITRNEDTRVDAELNKLIHDIQVEMATDVLYESYNGDGTLAGGKGKAIEVLRDGDDVPDVYKERSAIRKMIDTGQISLKYSGLTYCTNGYRCDQDGVVNSAFCVDCDSAIIDEAIASKWQRLHERCVGHLEFAYDCGDVSPVSYAHFVSQIKAAENVMTRFNIEFTPFEDLE